MNKAVAATNIWECIILCNDKLQNCCLWQKACVPVALCVSDPVPRWGHKGHFVVIKFAFCLFIFFFSCTWLLSRRGWGYRKKIDEGWGARGGSTVVHCVKLMMRQSSASSAASLLCSRNGNEMSTKCRSKDAFINSPGTWSRLTAILRTRTHPATPTLAQCPQCPHYPLFKWPMGGLSLFESFLLLRKSESLSSLWMCPVASVCACVICVGFGHDFT